MIFIGTLYKPDLSTGLSGFTGSKIAICVNFNLLVYNTWRRIHAQFGEPPPKLQSFKTVHSELSLLAQAGDTLSLRRGLRWQEIGAKSKEC